MGVNLTHYDVNWVYSCQNNKEAGYYLETRTNKGMDEDFLIVLRE